MNGFWEIVKIGDTNFCYMIVTKKGEYIAYTYDKDKAQMIIDDHNRPILEDIALTTPPRQGHEYNDHDVE